MTLNRRLATAAVFVALAVGLGACGDDDPADDGDAPTTGAGATETKTPESASGDAICAGAERIAAIDDEVDVIVRHHLTPVLSGADPAARDSAFQAFIDEYQELLVNRLDEISAAYDDLAGAVPEDLTDAVRTLQSGSEQLSGVILEAESADDLSSGFAALGDVSAETAEATSLVDEYTRAECDVILAD
jgi:hypothetical protein